MKCNQSRPGFELVSPCPIPTTITITPRQMIDTRTGGLGNKRTNYRIIKIGQNAENSLRDVRRPAVTQTPVKDDQQTLM